MVNLIYYSQKPFPVRWPAHLLGSQQKLPIIAAIYTKQERKFDELGAGKGGV